MSTWQTIHDTPFGYVALVRPEDPGGWRFRIVSHASSATDGSDRRYGNDAQHTSPDPATCDAVVTGWIKWDGCSHLDWAPVGEQRGDGYIHVCGDGAWLDLLAALEAVRKACVPGEGR